MNEKELAELYVKDIAEMQKQLEAENMTNLTMKQLFEERVDLEREISEATKENREPDSDIPHKLLVSGAAIIALTDITTMTVAAIGDSADRSLAKANTPQESLALNLALIDTLTNHCQVGSDIEYSVYEKMLLNSHIIKGDAPEITSMDDVYVDKVRYCYVREVRCYGLSDINDELKLVNPNASPYHEATLSELTSAAVVAKEYIIEPNHLTIENCMKDSYRLNLYHDLEEVDLIETAETIAAIEDTVNEKVKHIEQNPDSINSMEWNSFIDAMVVLSVDWSDISAHKKSQNSNKGNAFFEDIIASVKRMLLNSKDSQICDLAAKI